jgi:hypothetical protein
MDDNTNRRGAWPRAAMLAAAASIVLLTTACGSSPSSGSSDGPSAAGQSNPQKVVAYANCLRSHGVTGVSVGSGGAITINYQNMHMSTSGGGLPTGISLPPAIESAAKACRGLAPGGSRIAAPNQAQQEQSLQQGLKYAACIRKHGIPNLPDPSSNDTFNLSGTGINPRSPQFEAAEQACKSLLPANIGFSSSTKVPS